MDSHRLARVIARLTEDTKNLIERGLVTTDLGERVLTGYSYGEVYDWDGYFENIYLTHCGVTDYCARNVKAFLDRQTPSGFIERTLGRTYPKPRQHVKPFLAQTLLLGIRSGDDPQWLRGAYLERLILSIDYWFRYCDPDQNMLASWNSADHSGMDNQDSRAGEIDLMRIEGVDLNAYLYRELLAAAEIADLLGATADSTRLQARAKSVAEAVNTIMWSESDGFYFDRDDLTRELRKVRSVAGFLPLWAGIVPADRAKVLIETHLTDPKSFWLPFGVATYARNEPDYYQDVVGDECNWRGAVWVPTNYMVAHGLMRSGYEREALELAIRTLDLALEQPTTREFYNGEDGSGQGLDPFWGWSILAYVLVLELSERYDPTQIETQIGRPLVWENWSVEPLRTAMVALQVSAPDSGETGS